MAKTKTVEYTLSLDDLASSVYQKFVTAVQSGEVDISKAIKGSSGAFEEHGASINKVTQWIKQQRTEQRQHNFVIGQARDAVAAAALVTNLYSGTIGRQNASLQKTVGIVNSGVIAFQGLNAVTSFLPGPWSLLVSIGGGLAASILAMSNDAEKSTDVLRSHQQQIEALMSAYDEWQAKFKGVEDSTGNFTKAQADLTSKNAAILQQQINNYRAYLDEIENGEKIQVQLFGQTQEIRKTGLNATAEVNRKYLQESQTFQTAYNNAIAEGKSKEDARIEGIKAAKGELQGLIDKQNGYIAALASMTAAGTQAIGSLADLKAKLQSLQTEFDRASSSDARTKIRTDIDAINAAINDIQTIPKSSFVFTFGYELQKSFDAGKESVRRFQDSIKALFGSGSSEEVKIQLRIEADISAMEDSLLTEKQMIDSWEKSIVNSVQATENQKTRAVDIAAKKRIQIERAATQEAISGWKAEHQVATAMLGSIGVGVQGFVDQFLLDHREAKDELDAIWISIKNTALASLGQIMAQAAINAIVAGAIESAATAGTVAAMGITAAAAFPAAVAVNIASFGAAGLSAASSATVAGQATGFAMIPKLAFHEGSEGPVYFDAPSSRNIPIMVRGGETFEVKTETQQSSSGSTLIFNFNTPVPHSQWVVNSIEQHLRKTGLSIDKAIVNNRMAVAI